jgi:integrase
MRYWCRTFMLHQPRYHGATARSFAGLGVIEGLNDNVSTAFLEFFLSHIKRRNTRAAYICAIRAFLHYCAARGQQNFLDIRSSTVRQYIEDCRHSWSQSTINCNASAIRQLFQYLVRKGAIDFDTFDDDLKGITSSVDRRGEGATPKMEDVQRLRQAIARSSISGLRDRSILSMIVYTPLGLGEIVAAKFDETITLHLPTRKTVVHPIDLFSDREALSDFDAYLKALPIESDSDSVFRPIDRHGNVGRGSLTRIDIYRMIRRHARAAGLPSLTSVRAVQAAASEIRNSTQAFRKDRNAIENMR